MQKPMQNATVYLDHTCNKGVSELLEQDIQAERNTYTKFKNYLLTANVTGDTSAVLRLLPREEITELITNIIYSDLFSVSDYLTWTQTSVVTLDELRKAIYKASLNIALMLLCWKKVVNNIMKSNKPIYLKNSLVIQPTADYTNYSWGNQLECHPDYTSEYDVRIPFDIIGNNNRVKTADQEAFWNTIVFITAVDLTEIVKKCIQEKNSLFIYQDLPFEYYFILDFYSIYTPNWTDTGTHEGPVHSITLKEFTFKKAFATLCTEMSKEMTSLKKAASIQFK